MRPAKAMLNDGIVDVGERCPKEDFVVGDAVFLNDVKDASVFVYRNRFRYLVSR